MANESIEEAQSKILELTNQKASLKEKIALAAKLELKDKKMSGMRLCS